MDNHQSGPSAPQLSMQERFQVLLEPDVSRPVVPTKDLLILLQVHGAIQVIRIGGDGKVIHASPSSSDDDLASQKWYACPREAIVESLYGKAATKEGLRQILASISTISWNAHPGREYESFMELGYYKPDPRAIHYLPLLSDASRQPQED